MFGPAFVFVKRRSLWGLRQLLTPWIVVPEYMITVPALASKCFTCGRSHAVVRGRGNGTRALCDPARASHRKVSELSGEVVRRTPSVVYAFAKPKPAASIDHDPPGIKTSPPSPAAVQTSRSTQPKFTCSVRGWPSLYVYCVPRP